MMSLSHRPTKPPLDVLQSMINAILIETGKALRGSDKDGRSNSNATNRLRSTIPSAIENFHQALDDLEAYILRGKSVLSRDLAELQKQQAARRLSKTPETPEDAVLLQVKGDSQDSNALPETISIKQEASAIESPHGTSRVSVGATILKEEAAEETDISGSILEKLPTPPSSFLETTPGAGLNATLTEVEGKNETTQPTANGQDSTLDYLFDAPQGQNEAKIDTNYANVDFTFSNVNENDDPQTQDQSQTQIELDMPTLGGASQDFVVNELPQVNNSSEGANNEGVNSGNADTATKQGFSMDDLFGDLGDGTLDVDNMDMDIDLSKTMGGGDNNDFNDMFFGTGEDSLAGEAEMEHGDFDNAFFGLEDDNN